MNVLFYKDNLSTGRGADHLVCAQAAGLAQMGHKVTLATCPTDKAYTFDIDKSIEIVNVTRSTVRQFAVGFDVCIAAGSNEICDLTENGRFKPLVPTITELMLAPSGFFKWKRFIRNYRIKKAFNKSDVLQILCSSYEAELRKFALSPKVVTIGEWPDVREPSIGELSGVNRRKVIIYPAAVNKLKNQLLLIKSFAVVAYEFPEWELHIYGKMHKSYGRKCEKTVSKLRLENRIKFFPFTKDLPSVYASAEIMAFPSLLEGFPLTILEGALFGLPSVVVRELPGAEEMVEDGVTGLVSFNDVRLFANSLCRLMMDENLRKRLGGNARKRVRERFSYEKILKEWDLLVRKVADEKECAK